MFSRRAAAYFEQLNRARGADRQCQKKSQAAAGSISKEGSSTDSVSRPAKKGHQGLHPAANAACRLKSVFNARVGFCRRHGGRCHAAFATSSGSEIRSATRPNHGRFLFIPAAAETKYSAEPIRIDCR